MVESTDDLENRRARVLEEAVMIRELFGDRAEDAIQRRIASALDDLALDKAMYLLDVQSALYGLPIGHYSAEERAAARASDEQFRTIAEMYNTSDVPVGELSSELQRRIARRVGR